MILSCSGSRSKLAVRFKNSVNFVPLKACFYYGAEVDLLNSFIRYNEKRNSYNYSLEKKTAFFSQTKQIAAQETFVFKAINKATSSSSSACGTIGPHIEGEISVNDTMTIMEENRRYRILELSDSSERSYYVYKKSGKITDIMCAIFKFPDFNGLEEDQFLY